MNEIVHLSFCTERKTLTTLYKKGRRERKCDDTSESLISEIQVVKLGRDTSSTHHSLLFHFRREKELRGCL